MPSESEKREAKQLRKNLLLPKVLDQLKADQLTEWEAADAPDKREQHWYLVKAITELRDQLDARIKEILGDE